MAASTGSSYTFRVLTDTFGPVKFRQENPDFSDLDSEVDFNFDNIPAEPTSGVNTAAPSNAAAPSDVPAPSGAPSGPPPPPPLPAYLTEDNTDGTGGVSNPALQTDEVGGSSNTSSVTELSAAQERGLRTSFRVIPEQQAALKASKSQDDAPALKTADVHVRGVPGDIDVDTPASTASSTARFFLTKSGQPKTFNVGNLQPPPHNAQTSSLSDTTRDVIRRENSSAADLNKSPYGSPDNDLSRPANGFAMMTGNEGLPYPYEKPDKEKTTHCCPKLMAFIVALLFIIGGVVVAIFVLKEDKPDKLHGTVHKGTTEKPEADVCSELDVKLRDIINTTCRLRSTKYMVPKQLRIVPPDWVNKGTPMLLGLDPKVPDGDWSAEFDVTRQAITIIGPKALCSSDGLYGLQLLNNRNISMFTSSIQINVISEVSKVNFSLSQSVEDNTTDFTVGCSTNSGCEQSFVDFFAEMNQKERYLSEVNFTCVVDYNHYAGFSVSCIGVIPDYLMAQFGRITCRPRSKLLDDLDDEELEELEEYLELPECDISKHCGFKCPTPGDYFLVNSGRCDIFHRCHNMQVYTSYCAPGTFFDPTKCSCRHTTDLDWCQDNGAVKPKAVAPTDHTCEVGDVE